MKPRKQIFKIALEMLHFVFKTKYTIKFELYEIDLRVLLNPYRKFLFKVQMNICKFFSNYGPKKFAKPAVLFIYAN